MTDTGIEAYTVRKNNKTLRLGYTTGTCAAAAAAAAVRALLFGKVPERVSILTPKGIRLNLPIRDCGSDSGCPVCAVQKYSGDDPDVTNGVWVYARAEEVPGEGIEIEGGTGVGRVTRPGLEQPVGAAAINRVPRRMIAEAVEAVREEAASVCGLRIVISIPEGVALVEKTFNSRLGITGGISVLGTTGIVEPMSEEALIATIRTELATKIAGGDRHLLISPGNYGAAFIREHLGLDLEDAVKCSNYVGATIDIAVELGAESILFVSHIGKFIKVAGGIMNTHSREADCRMELLAAHAALAGAGAEEIREILACLTTDEALAVLDRGGRIPAVMTTVLKKIEEACDKRSYGHLAVGALLFSNEWGELGRSETAERLLREVWLPRREGGDGA